MLTSFSDKHLLQNTHTLHYAISMFNLIQNLFLLYSTKKYPKLTLQDQMQIFPLAVLQQSNSLEDEQHSRLVVQSNTRNPIYPNRNRSFHQKYLHLFHITNDEKRIIAISVIPSYLESCYPLSCLVVVSNDCMRLHGGISKNIIINTQIIIIANGNQLGTIVLLEICTRYTSALGKFLLRLICLLTLAYHSSITNANCIIQRRSTKNIIILPISRDTLSFLFLKSENRRIIRTQIQSSHISSHCGIIKLIPTVIKINSSKHV